MTQLDTCAEQDAGSAGPLGITSRCSPARMAVLRFLATHPDTGAEVDELRWVMRAADPRINTRLRASEVLTSLRRDLLIECETVPGKGRRWFSRGARHTAAVRRQAPVHGSASA